MKVINYKSILAGFMGTALLGFSSTALAGWDSNDCSGVSGTAPCIDTDVGGSDVHFNGTGGHAGNWHGAPGGGDFEFVGETLLTCPDLPPATCDLTLYGEVRKFQDNGDWKIGLRVNDGSVASGDSLCAFIDVTDFEWFLGPDGVNSGFGPNSGVDYVPSATSYTGNIGGSPTTNGITVTVLGSPVAEYDYVESVIYDNQNTFSFDSDLYHIGTNTSSGCTVEGDLVLQDGTYLTIH
ncbi:MAG: hypothetical protein VYC49_15990 [Pseudomonadota bacterium]|jgi:hypothetical protein|nr:hypothetical protein [Pseudomonadota bacterium]|tara:strand:+ start:5636 stop:6346 length:711 start_codon:yes stop_codon:yes gene_type:complete